MTVTSRTPVRRAAALMKGRSVGSLVVTARNGKVAGIVTVSICWNTSRASPNASPIAARRAEEVVLDE